MTYAFGNAQHIGRRSQQQDAFCFSNTGDEAFVSHGGVAAVLADGMGGMQHGGEASRTAAAAFLNAYRRKNTDEPIRDALYRSVHEANAAVYALALESGAGGEMGTTIVAAVLHADELHWVSVGDSALLLLRGGQLSQLNAVHNYATILDARVAAGQLSAAEALSDPQREALISHVGAESIPHVDLNGPLRLDAGDTVYLATDGLYRTLTADEMLSYMTGPPQEQCERLVGEALARGRENQDNVTILALSAYGSVESREPEPPAEPAPETAGVVPPAAPKRRWAVAAVAAFLLAALLGAGYWRYVYAAPVPPAAAADSTGAADGARR
ncbi:MAG: protein phosphatase 2C domain-containing protein [Bryobacteraceae bacterium]